MADAPDLPSSTTDATAVPPRYRLIDVLGQGAFGRVWRAEDLLDGGEVALKVLYTSSVAADQLASEFRAAVEVSHPHVVRMLDFGTMAAGRAYLAMQLLHAKPFDRAAEGRPVGDVLTWTGQALMAMDALRRRGMLHGDIKANNVLVEPHGPGRAYLTDFGLAAVAGERGSGIGGTPAYTAPELLAGCCRDVRSDLYSLGVVLYEALAGSNPFLAKDVRETFARHKALDPPPLDALRGDVSAAAARFVSRLLAKNPDRRWQSPAHALGELEGLVGIASPLSAAWLEQRIQDPPMVGRDVAHTSIIDALSALAQGAGAARWLEAEAGHGKTALLERARQVALVSGLRVGRATCHVGGGPWDSLVRAVAEATATATDLLGITQADSATEVADAISKALGSHPTALLLDDADLAPGPLWSALLLLLQRVAETPLVLVWTSRPAKDASHPARKLDLSWANAERAGHAEKLSLPSLTQPQAATLLESALGGAVDEDSLVLPLWRSSHGCPGVLLELLRHSVRAGQVDATPTGWRGALDTARLSSLEGDVARALADLEDSRIGALENAARHSLEALAILRTPASPALVAAVSGIGRGEARAGLQRLADAGLADQSRSDGTSYCIRQVSLAHRLVSRMGAARKQRLHAAAARALSTELEANDWEGMTRVALHWARAEQWPTAFELSEEIARNAPHDALPLQYGELSTLLLSQEEEAANRPGWAVTALMATAAGYCAAGRYADALLATEEARVAAWGKDAEELELDRLRVDALAHLGRREDAEATLERATARVERLQATGQVTPLACAELAASEAEARRIFSDSDRARSAAVRGLELIGWAQGRREQEVRARLLIELATADLHQSNFEACRTAGMEALALAKELGIREVEARAATAVGNALRALGHTNAAIEQYAAARNVAASLGWVGLAGKAANNMAICHYLQGRWEDAAAEWRGAVRFAEQSGDREEKVVLLNNLGFLYFERGHAERADAALSEGIELALESRSDRVLVGLYGNLGELRYRQGQYAAARSLYAQAIERAQRLDAKADLVELSRRMAELLMAQGRCDDAAQEAERALSLATSVGAAAEAARLRGILAVAAAEAGDATGAANHLDCASALIGGAGEESLDTAILAMHRARALESLGEHAEALTLMTAVRARIEALGALWFEREADVHLARLRRRALFESRGSNHCDEGSNTVGTLLAQMQQAADMEALAVNLLNHALDVSGASRGTISIQTMRELEGFAVSMGREDGASAWGQSGDPYSRTIALGVLETGQEMLVENVLDDDCLSATESVMAMNLHSVLCMPVSVLGEVRGILYVDSTSLIGDRLTAARPVLRALLAAYGTAIERSVWKRRYEAQVETVAQVAHELRSPLGSILGFAQLAEQAAPEGSYGEVVADLVRVVLNEGGRMTHLVKRMYDLWMVNAAPSVKLEEHSAFALANNVIRALRPQAATASVELVNCVPESLPPVLIDERGVQQIFTNLIANALRHTPAGKRVFLRAELAPEPVRLGDRRMVILEVSDEGVGLSEENKVRIFRRFDRGSSPSGAGTGLGLSIVQDIVSDHGGKLWVESELGHGARFRFTVPVLSQARSEETEAQDSDVADLRSFRPHSLSAPTR